jgi:DNA helicase II / ATP-dependent DNA helicase PcrA
VGVTTQGTVYSVLGPPGTGKTTYISRQVERLTDQHGPQAVLLASFTRSAATTLAGRTQLPKEQVGTLHALAYRVLGHPELAETDEALALWNQENPRDDRRLARTGSNDPDDATAPDWSNASGAGDDLLAELNSERARMRPRDKWSARVRAFEADWTAHKRKHNLADFTDLIEHVAEQDLPPPGEATVGFFDEVQDFTRLENHLVRRWAQRFDHTVLAGDDDQTIYTFKGADPLVLTDGVAPERTRVLAQSYRVPQAVHQQAEKLVARLSQRAPKEYRPRDAEGAFTRAPQLRYKDPQALGDLLERLPGTVMVLATAGYMLNPTLSYLRENGIPYHNPYRKNRGDWNPLAPTKGTSTSSRLYSYSSPPARGELWTYTQLAAWTPLLNSEALQKGARAAIERAADRPDAPTTTPDLAQLLEWLTPETLDHALRGDLLWLRQNLHKKHQTAKTQLALATLLKNPKLDLNATPRVVVGTVHSVKGAEADHVVLYPDLSSKAYAAYLTSGLPRDSVTRVMYVAATRAKESLTLAAASERSYLWPS